MAAARGPHGGPTSPFVRPRVAAGGWGCGLTRDHLPSDRPPGPLGSSAHPDGPDRRRRPGPIDDGACAGRLPPDERDAEYGHARMTGIRASQPRVREVI